MPQPPAVKRLGGRTAVPGSCPRGFAVSSIKEEYFLAQSLVFSDYTMKVLRSKIRKYPPLTQTGHTGSRLLLHSFQGKNGEDTPHVQGRPERAERGEGQAAGGWGCLRQG